MNDEEAAAWADLVAAAAEQNLEVLSRQCAHGIGWGCAYLPLSPKDARDVWYAEHVGETLLEAIAKCRAAIEARKK